MTAAMSGSCASRAAKSGPQKGPVEDTASVMGRTLLPGVGCDAVLCKRFGRDCPGPKHHGLVAGQVDDRRRKSGLRRGTTVEKNSNSGAELQPRVERSRRGRMTGSVGAGDGERPGLPDQLEGEWMVRHAYGDR